jgi:hypothetical protein
VIRLITDVFRLVYRRLIDLVSFLAQVLPAAGDVVVKVKP